MRGVREFRYSRPTPEHPQPVALFRTDEADIEQRRKQLEAAKRRLAELRKIRIFFF